jgi:hypothetical protein
MGLMSDSEVNFANEWPAASITLVIQAEESALERRGLVNAVTSSLLRDKKSCRIEKIGTFKLCQHVIFSIWLDIT